MSMTCRCVLVLSSWKKIGKLWLLRRVLSLAPRGARVHCLIKTGPGCLNIQRRKLTPDNLHKHYVLVAGDLRGNECSDSGPGFCIPSAAEGHIIRKMQP